MREELVDGLIDELYRHHEPHRAWPVELRDEVAERSGADRTVLRELPHGLRRDIEDDAIVTALEQTAHHVAAHSAEADHSELHLRLLRLARLCERRALGGDDVEQVVPGGDERGGAV